MHSGKPHEPERVKKATQQVEEFVRILEMEGVKVRRPDLVNWMDVGDYRTADFEEGGEERGERNMAFDKDF